MPAGDRQCLQMSESKSKTVSSDGLWWGTEIDCTVVPSLGVPAPPILADYFHRGGQTGGTWWPNQPIYQEKLNIHIFL
jgi:hypothetical protein